MDFIISMTKVKEFATKEWNNLSIVKREKGQELT